MRCQGLSARLGFVVQAGTNAVVYARVSNKDKGQDAENRPASHELTGLLWTDYPTTGILSPVRAQVAEALD